MCNAKPGQRCQKDSFNMLQNRVSKFAGYTEKINTNTMNREQTRRVREMAEDIDEHKVFYYATAGAQKDPYEAINHVSRLNKGILMKNQDYLEPNETALFRTGQYLSKLQEYADKYRRENKTSQLDTARKMKTVDGFDYVVRGYENKFASEEDAALKELLGPERPQGWERQPEVIEIRDKYAMKASYLHRAFEIANKEAGDIIQRDQHKNSKNYELGTPDAPVKVSYWKTYDGVFEATSNFRVDASTQGEAESKAQRIFSWPAKFDVVKSRNSDKYIVNVKYLWQGSERVEDMHHHHLRFWKPENYLV